MSTQEVANRLVELCRKGEYEKAVEELYSPAIKSIEPAGAMMPTVEGFEGIQAKSEQWAAQIKEMHGGHVSEPLVADNYFSVAMGFDATFLDGNRVKSDEICVYQVEDGKIVHEQFFYSPPPTA